ncbi:MAG: hypothetical protein IPK39_04515 [Sulfuritalea sp.]|nr:hypothetical protein [Sulfuritalea sp.]
MLLILMNLLLNSRSPFRLWRCNSTGTSEMLRQDQQALEDSVTQTQSAIAPQEPVLDGRQKQNGNPNGNPAEPKYTFGF